MKQLNKVHKSYIDLAIEKVIREKGRVTEQDLEFMASTLGCSVEQVRNYANVIVSQNEPKEVEKIPISPQAKYVREQFTPREGISMMNPNLSEHIDKNPANFKTKSRHENAIYRPDSKK